MQETIDRLRSEGAERIAALTEVADIESIRVALLGRKGEVTQLLRGLKDVPDEDRPAMGAELNRLKVDLSALAKLPEKEASTAEFLESLPDFLGARQLMQLTFSRVYRMALISTAT